MTTRSSNPLDRDPDIAIGITLPLRRGHTGYFEQSFTTIDQVKSNIRNLFMTKKKERLMQPEFGCDLWTLVFEQSDVELEELVDETIRDTLNFWMPFIDVREVIIKRDSADIDMYRIETEVRFTVSNDPSTLHTVTFTIE